MTRSLFLMVLLQLAMAGPLAAAQKTPPKPVAPPKAVAPAPKPVVPAVYTLSVDTGLVMKSGDVKPVARGDFYLLNRDLTDILADVGFLASQYTEEPPSNVTALTVFAGNRKLEKVLGPLPGASGETNKGEKAAFAAIQAHKVGSATTDFSGKGKFKAPPGTYFVYGVATIGNNFVLWNVKTNLKGNQTLTLENRNAAVITSLTNLFDN